MKITEIYEALQDLPDRMLTLVFLPGRFRSCGGRCFCFGTCWSSQFPSRIRWFFLLCFFQYPFFSRFSIVNSALVIASCFEVVLPNV